MTRDDIIRMAQEADDFADSYTPQYVTLPNEWSVIRDGRFAALVAAAERERIIAKNAPVIELINAYIKKMEDNIRARGQT